MGFENAKACQNPHAHEVFAVERNGVGEDILCDPWNCLMHSITMTEAVSNDTMTLETTVRESFRSRYLLLKFLKHVRLQPNKANNFYKYLDFLRL
jgi:hypothetical protein